MTISAPWNQSIARESAIVYALNQPSILFLRRSGVWILFALIATIIISLNWPFETTLQIAKLDLSIIAQTTVLLLAIAASGFTALILSRVIGFQWRDHIHSSIGPWPSDANVVRDYSFDRTGFSMNSSFSSHRYSWLTLSSIETKGDFIFLISGRHMLTAIPFSSFSSPSDAITFANRLRNYHSEQNAAEQPATSLQSKSK